MTAPAAARGAGRAVKAVGRSGSAPRAHPTDADVTSGTAISLAPTTATYGRRRKLRETTGRAAPPATPAPAAPPAPPAPSVRPAPARASQGFSRPRVGGAGGAVATAAGFVLGLVFWGWVALPFLTGGPARVRSVWRAKFLNRGPDGKPLP